MKKEHVKLSISEKTELEALLSNENIKSRVFKRIMGLLELNKGYNYEQVSQTVLLSSRTLRRLAKRYQAEGLKSIYRRAQSGRPPKTTQELEDQLVLLSCSEAPEGYRKWSLRLLADKVVALGYCDTLSHTQVAKI